jgi:hypothetical protein
MMNVIGGAGEWAAILLLMSGWLRKRGDEKFLRGM